MMRELKEIVDKVNLISHKLDILINTTDTIKTSSLNSIATEDHKRFLVFIYEEYYPSGGMGDCKENFDTEDDALKYIEDVKKKRNHGYDYFEIYDRVKGVEV